MKVQASDVEIGVKIEGVKARDETEEKIEGVKTEVEIGVKICGGRGERIKEEVKIDNQTNVLYSA